MKPGAHLGAVRSWIQQLCRNGSSVTWNSYDVLEFNGALTVCELEALAERIRTAVLKETGPTLSHVERKLLKCGCSSAAIEWIKERGFSFSVNGRPSDHKSLSLKGIIERMLDKIRTESKDD